jgi:hypothetical protein
MDRLEFYSKEGEMEGERQRRDRRYIGGEIDVKRQRRT